MNFGHYVCYCKNYLTKKWYLYNDEKVELVEDIQSVNFEDAYICFY